MGRTVRISETQIKTIITRIINEGTEINEYGGRGKDEHKWDEEDQTLAMFNSRFGIKELDMTEKEIAVNVIDTTVGSLAKQTLNFDFLDGKNGLNRPNEMQNQVYMKYKGLSKNELKQICQKIIENRLNSPKDSIVKKRLGNEIGTKRDTIHNDRMEKLRAAGVKHPERAIMVGQDYVKNNNDDTSDIKPIVPEKEPMTRKKEVQDYLSHIYSELNRLGLLSLADEVEEINNYIGDKLTDRETISELYKIIKRPNVVSEHLKSIKKVINENRKMKKTIRLTESELDKFIMKIIKEQGFDRFNDDDLDDEMDRNDAIDRWVSDDDDDTLNQIHYNPRGQEMFKSAAEDLLSQGYGQEDLFAMLGELLRPKKNGY